MTTITHTWEESPDSSAHIVKWWREVDRFSLAAVLTLFIIGVILCSSSTTPLAERNNVPSMYYFFRHLILGLGGLSVMILLSMLQPKAALRVGCWVFLISFLLILFLPIIGTDFGKGSIRWLSLGFTSIQPSEFLKPGLIIFSAWLFRGAFENNNNFGIYLSIFITLTCCFLLVLQPDFGQTGLVILGWCAIYFAAGAPIMLLIFIGTILIAGAYFAYSYSSHFAGRIDSFIASILGTSTNNDQVGISFASIQNGSITGTGPGGGEYKWNLPDGHTDFIIAIAAEEYGLILVLAIIAIYLFIVLRSFYRLSKVRDNFLLFAGTGLVINIIAQAFINLAVSAKLFPPTGMTLPLISYGGSSMLAIGISLGLLFCFTRIPEENERDNYVF